MDSWLESATPPCFFDIINSVAKEGVHMSEINLRKTASSYPYETPWFKVREDTVERSDGTSTTFYIVECPESAFIVPVTDDNKVVLVKLFRYRTQRGGWEVPAGSVDLGEDKLSAAKRELQEETGYEAKEIRELTPSFDSMNGASDAIAHVFVATGLTQSHHNEQAEEGITEMRAFAWNEIIDMIKNGEIVDGLSIAALMKYYTEIENN
jgi:8-oxo-dGTP pyrophosphatase MutT (NUDIX family)